MGWSNFARSALFGLAICCVAVPEAEAIEIFAPPGLAAHMVDGTIIHVRGGRGGGGMRHGGGHRGGGARYAGGGAIAAAARATQAERIAVAQATVIAAATVTMVIVVATAIVATAMGGRRSAQRRSARRLPHTIVGSIVTVPGSVTPTNLTAPTSYAKGARSKGNVRVDWHGHSALKTRKTTPCTSSAEATSLDAAQMPASDDVDGSWPPPAAHVRSLGSRTARFRSPE